MMSGRNKVDIIARDYQEPSPSPEPEEDKDAPITSLKEIGERRPKIKLVRDYFRGVIEKLQDLEGEEFE
jgi:hypothetical protein